MIRLLKASSKDIVATFDTTSALGDYLLDEGYVKTFENRKAEVKKAGKIIKGDSKYRTIAGGKFTVDEQSVDDYKFTPPEELVFIFNKLIEIEVEYNKNSDIGTKYSEEDFFDNEGLVSPVWREMLIANKRSDKFKPEYYDGDCQTVEDILEYGRSYLVTKLLFKKEFVQKVVGENTIYRVCNPFSTKSKFSFSIKTSLIPVDANCFELKYSKEFNTLEYLPKRRFGGKQVENWADRPVVLADNPQGFSNEVLTGELLDLKRRVKELELDVKEAKKEVREAKKRIRDLEERNESLEEMKEFLAFLKARDLDAVKEQWEQFQKSKEVL